MSNNPALKTRPVLNVDNTIINQKFKKMKKMYLLIMCLAFIYPSAYGGEPPVNIQIKPPAVVQKAFEKKFPNATKVSWGKESPKEWEAEFTFEGNKISANFADDGTWVETERKIKITDLPKAVAAAIKSSFPGWTIIEADKTETLKNGTVYEADLKKGKTKKGVAFKEDGSRATE
jgi:Putative beta-lactamase-inhibitor-like, PepSY-like